LDLDPNYGVLLELDMLLMLAMMGLALVLLQLLGLDHLLVDPLLSLSLSLLLALHLEDLELEQRLALELMNRLLLALKLAMAQEGMPGEGKLLDQPSEGMLLFALLALMLLALMLGSMLVQWDHYLKMTFSVAAWAEEGVEVADPIASDDLYIVYRLSFLFRAYRTDSASMRW